MRQAILGTSAPALVNGVNNQAIGIQNVTNALKSSDTEAEVNQEAASVREVYPQTDKHRGRVTVHTPMHSRKGRKVRTEGQLR